MGAKHVGVGRLIKFLKDTAISTEQTMTRIHAGHGWPVPDKKKTILREKRLRSVLCRNRDDLSNLIQNIAYNIKVAN